MKEDQALIDAGIEHARAIVICANNSLANLEVALDARRMNSKIRVVMRLFDEQIVHKLSDAMDVDVAFSSSTLAAPIVAAMAMQGAIGTDDGAKVLSSVMIDGVCHVAAEVTVKPNSRWVGKRHAELEQTIEAKVLSRRTNGDVISAGDRLVVHAPATKLSALSS